MIHNKSKEDELNALAIELYKAHGRTFVPLFPWVFVRVLPKDQVTAGGLVVPGNQNKPTHEGIVLATWAPRAKKSGGFEFSQLCEGEHVLFNHFAGIPIEGYAPEHYRVVKECNWAKDNEGGIFATVNYKCPNVREELIKLGVYHLQINDILERFILLDKSYKGVTLSGR